METSFHPRDLVANMTLDELADLLVDDLTGVLNRKGFRYRLAQCHYSQVAVMMIDVDHFKSFNDTYGHELGDIVLRRVAQALQANLRQTDEILTRWGGEEFFVYLPFSGVEELAKICQRLRKAVEKLTILPQRRVTISIGVAYSQDPTDLDTLRQNADIALYRAKDAGRNRARCHSNVA